MRATEVRSDKNRLCGILHANLGWLLWPLALFSVYLSTGQLIASPDNLALRYLPLSLIHEGNFDLNEFAFLYAERLILYPIVYQDGYLLPFAPVGPALLAAPFYLIPALAGVDGTSPWLPFVEKVAASGITTLSVFFIYLTLARLVSTRKALFVSGLYALGTATFGVSSQALWPVGSAQLLLAVGLYCLIRGRTDGRWTTFAALPLSWAVLCRPSSALIGLLVGIYVMVHCRRQFIAFVLLAMPAVVFQSLYNVAYFGQPFLSPGYVSSGGHMLANLDNVIHTPLWQGLAGLLISPAVGFLVFSPVYLCAPIGFYRRWRQGDPLALYLAAAALAVLLLLSRLNMWWGGAFLGPRYVIEVAPILTYFLAFGIGGWRVWKKILVGVLAVWSVYANSLLAFAFDGSYDHRAELWSWSNNPIVHYSRQSLQRGGDWLLWAGEQVRQDSHDRLDSRTTDGLRVDLEVGPFPSRVSANAFLDVIMRLKNTGEATWRHSTPDGLGMVRPAWRWVEGHGGREVGMEGRGPELRADLLPGQQTQLLTRIWTPPEPGLYALELGMVSERVAWFGPQSGRPTYTLIEVSGQPLCPFEPGLAALTGQMEMPLDIQWVADRTVLRGDEVLAARLTTVNSGPPRVLYPVIVLRWPSGAHTYWDFGRAAFQDVCPFWHRPQWPLFLDHGYRAVEYPILSLLLADMPAGSYTLYFLYLQTKDSTIQLAGKASLVFERLP